MDRLRLCIPAGSHAITPHIHSRASQVPLPIFPCALLSTTPSAPVTLSPFVQSPVPGFTISGRLTKHHLRNEAELDSLALRLAGSHFEASPYGLLRTALDSYMSNG